MGSKQTHNIKLQPTSSAVDWDIVVKNDYDIERIALSFSAAPAAIENIIVTQKDGSDSNFDMVLRVSDPNGKTTVCFEQIKGIVSGDYINVYYENTDGATVRGVATVQL
jgi:hypothetical protein